MRPAAFGSAILAGLRAFAGIYREGHRVKPEGPLFWLIAAMATPLTLWELWLGLRGSMQPLTIAIVFVSVLYAVSFLTVTLSPRHPRITVIDYGLAVLSMACSVYLMQQTPRYVEWIAGISRFTTMDLIVGTTTLLLSLELLRRCVGLGLSLVVYALLAYVFFGHHLSGTFSHRPFDVPFFVEQMIISINGGLFGVPIQVAATYAFLFILFGKFIESIGGGQFFFDTAAALTGRRPGGVAKVAVVSSGLFGTISGSPAADVMTTGSITIPAMKRLGYSPRFAGAVEAVASTGGSLLPPVMGAVVFLMAEFTGIEYGDIAKSAVFVALLYYLSVYYQVHLRALKTGLIGMERSQIPSLGHALRGGWHNVVPFSVLVYFLVEGYTAAYVASMGVLAAFLISWLHRRTWVTPLRFIRITVSTVYALAPLVAAVAAAGIVIGGLNLTGLAGKMSSLIFALTGGSTLLALVVAAAVTILLGMGMPVVAAYALVAVLVAPVLIELGLPVLQVHLFLVYYSVLSAITPPIAIACYVASSIAETSPMAIARESVKLGLVSFVIPFMFIYHPSLLLIGDWGHVALAVASATIGVMFLCIALEGWLVRRVGLLGRVTIGTAGGLTLFPGILTDAVGVVLGVVVLLNQYQWQFGALLRSAPWCRRVKAGG